MKERFRNITLAFLLFVTVISFSACGNNANTGSESMPSNNEEIEDAEIISEASIATPTSGECGEGLTYNLTKEGTLTISGSGKMKSFEYDFINDKPSIDTPWFEQKDNIKKVIVEDGVTTLSEYAFYGCSNLEDVELPESIVNIYSEAFAYCTSLKSIIIPNGVSNISLKTFMSCTSLEQVVISSNVKTIENYAFMNCDSLREIVIPDGVHTIYNQVFLNCDMLNKTTIPASVTKIGSHIFKGCENDVTIYTTSGSVAENYAKDNGLKVEIIGG